MKLVVRPIRYTAHLSEMRVWAQAMGLVELLDTGAWLVLGADHGRLALHAVPDGDPLAGTTTLAVETDDLDALERRWADVGMATRRTDDHDIPLVFGCTPLGGEVAAGVASPSSASTEPERTLAVMPMLVTREVAATAEWLQTWGWRRRISSDGGGWVDLELPAGGGLVGIHDAGNLESEPPSVPAGVASREVPVSLTFEHSDVDALLARARAAGLEGAHVIDEAYNRTLLVPSPDGDTIWINGEQTDLYGYRREGTARPAR
jgi:hypothetical protein